MTEDEAHYQAFLDDRAADEAERTARGLTPAQWAHVVEETRREMLKTMSELNAALRRFLHTLH
jgi:hypothetical protein